MISPLQALGLQRGDALGEDLFRDALNFFSTPHHSEAGALTAIVALLNVLRILRRSRE
jgi:hypothetical protein